MTFSLGGKIFLMIIVRLSVVNVFRFTIIENHMLIRYANSVEITMTS